MRSPQQAALPLQSATDGFIKDGRYTYNGTNSVYAVRTFRGTVRAVGTDGQFRTTGAGADTTMSMAISANDDVNTDMLHFASSRSDWVVEVRRARGAYRIVAKGRFSPPLDLGRDYRFMMKATDQNVTVTVPGSEVTRKASTLGLLGSHAFWQEYPRRLPVGVVFDFDTVWAVEDGQQLFPVVG